MRISVPHSNFKTRNLQRSRGLGELLARFCREVVLTSGLRKASVGKSYRLHRLPVFDSCE